MQLIEPNKPNKFNGGVGIVELISVKVSTKWRNHG